jgi:hypothetical protein
MLREEELRHLLQIAPNGVEILPGPEELPQVSLSSDWVNGTIDIYEVSPEQISQVTQELRQLFPQILFSEEVYQDLIREYIYFINFNFWMIAISLKVQHQLGAKGDLQEMDRLNDPQEPLAIPYLLAKTSFKEFLISFLTYHLAKQHQDYDLVATQELGDLEASSTLEEAAKQGDIFAEMVNRLAFHPQQRTIEGEIRETLEKLSEVELVKEYLKVIPTGTSSS